MAKKDFLFSILGATTVIIIVFAISVSLISNRSKQLKVGDKDTSKSTIASSLQANVLSDSTQWNEGKDYNVRVELDELPEELPTAFTIYLSYDPESLEFVSIESGNLWTEDNVINQEIDEEAGTISFSVGQGFTAESAGGSVIANLNFRAIGESGVIKVLDQSMFALKGNPIKIVSDQFNYNIQ